MSGALTGPNSRPTWKPKFLSTRNCIIVWISTCVLRTSPAPRPQIPAGIQDEIRLKTRLRRRWQFTWDPALKTEVNRLQRSVTRRLNEWRNDQWSATLGSLNPEDQSLWKMSKRAMRVPTPSPPLVTPGESLSQTLRKLKPSPTVWRLSFSRSPFLRSGRH